MFLCSKIRSTILKCHTLNTPSYPGQGMALNMCIGGSSCFSKQRHLYFTKLSVFKNWAKFQPPCKTYSSKAAVQFTKQIFSWHLYTFGVHIDEVSFYKGLSILSSPKRETYLHQVKIIKEPPQKCHSAPS